MFEITEQIPVNIFAGDELTFVKADTMVEQGFYVRSNNLLGMFVDSVFQFFFYLIETIEDNLAFAFGHMQGFVGFVRKECVILHSTGEWSTI